jgi:aminoglycoside phosphotransferase (APT) family kinase protein
VADDREAPARRLAVMETASTFEPATVAANLVTYLGGQLGTDVQVSGVKRYTVGFSWITYGFEASWREGTTERLASWILRIGPPTGLFAPYNAYPQFAALATLHGSAVPVPRALWYGDELESFGAPFFICEKVEGEAPLPWVAEGREAFPEPLREALAEQFVAALAALHRFEWRGTPLEALGGGVDERSAAGAQIAFWEGLLARWAFRPYPMLEWGISWLKAHRPVASRVSIVHGDYRTGNFLESGGQITAILDWELVHLGDPLEDLGWICMRSFRGRSPRMCHLMEREALYERYEALSGIPVSPAVVRFYEALGTFKLAVIHVAAARCFEDGRYKDLRLAALGVHLPRLFLQLEAAIEGRT